MALLIRAALAVTIALAGTACYAPALRDCTVTGRGAGDCATGQVCGSDGYCAAPEIAGACSTLPDAPARADAPTADARFDAAPMIDAMPAIDSRPTAQLHITITGKGTVDSNVMSVTCTAPPGDCLFTVDDGSSITLTAVGAGAGHPFQQWTTDNCKDQGASCTLVVTAPVTAVGAKFK
jgi:hypothetical protein